MLPKCLDESKQFITLLPALYHHNAHKQPVPLQCWLLQQVVAAATLCWQPTDSPCCPLPITLQWCCLRYQASASWEYQLILSILPWCTVVLYHGPASPLLAQPCFSKIILQKGSLLKLLSPFCSKVEHAGVLLKYHTRLLAGGERERALWGLWKERGR